MKKLDTEYEGIKCSLYDTFSLLNFRCNVSDIKGVLKRRTRRIKIKLLNAVVANWVTRFV